MNDSERANWVAEKTSLPLETFDYPLPESLIAQCPTENRSGAKLLHWSREKIHLHGISDLPSLVPRGTLIIANNSKVIPARIKTQFATGGKAELFLMEMLHHATDETIWRAIGRPLRKLLKQGRLSIKGIEVLLRADETYDDALTCRFPMDLSSFLQWLPSTGETPLPPYIRREQSKLDLDRYQTVYANPEGSVAAPTAGLHITEELVQKLAANDCTWHEITLHVGGGTFLPVKTDDLNQHIMHRENYRVGLETLQALLAAKDKKTPVLVIGTTTLRCLESFYLKHRGQIEKMFAQADEWHSTDLFLRPNDSQKVYQPWSATHMMTNFHQPKSTLFMLICSLIGINQAKETYQYAINHGLRFFSYGDSCLFKLD